MLQDLYNRMTRIMIIRILINTMCLILMVFASLASLGNKSCGCKPVTWHEDLTTSSYASIGSPGSPELKWLYIVYTANKRSKWLFFFTLGKQCKWIRHCHMIQKYDTKFRSEVFFSKIKDLSIPLDFFAYYLLTQFIGKPSELSMLIIIQSRPSKANFIGLISL